MSGLEHKRGLELSPAVKKINFFLKNRLLCAGKRKDGTKYKKFGESKIIRINIYQTTNKNLDSAPDLEI